MYVQLYMYFEHQQVDSEKPSVLDFPLFKAVL